MFAPQKIKKLFFANVHDYIGIKKIKKFRNCL